jgi:hypothetical protein
MFTTNGIRQDSQPAETRDLTGSADLAAQGSRQGAAPRSASGNGPPMYLPPAS